MTVMTVRRKMRAAQAGKTVSRLTARLVGLEVAVGVELTVSSVDLHSDLVTFYMVATNPSALRAALTAACTALGLKQDQQGWSATIAGRTSHNERADVIGVQIMEVKPPADLTQIKP